MIFLGIDPGYGRVGFGLIESKDGKIRYLGSGIVNTDSSQEFYARLTEIQKDLLYLIDKYNPDVACVETLFFSKNTKTALKVAEARGVINMTLFSNKIQLMEVGPTTVKSALTGDGRADKKQVEFMVKKILNLQNLKAIDDACDALGMAIFAANNYLEI